MSIFSCPFRCQDSYQQSSRFSVLHPQTRSYTTGPPDSQASGLRWNQTSSFPGSPACGRQNVGPLSLHNHGGQFLSICLSIYHLSILFNFSGEPNSYTFSLNCERLKVMPSRQPFWMPLHGLRSNASPCQAPSVSSSLWCLIVLQFCQLASCLLSFPNISPLMYICRFIKFSNSPKWHFFLCS